MFDAFEPFNFTTESEPHVVIHGIKSGDSTSSLPPLLLLHGFPQTHHTWHYIAPQLLHKYTIVIPDLRGYGESSKPDPVSAYAKSAMARDCIAVMDQLGFGSFFVCAHDRGARVAHKLLVDHPDRVRSAILLDICPTLAMYSATSFDFAKHYFHWFFLIQEAPLPETLVSGSARKVADAFLGGAQPWFEQGVYEHYVKSLEDPDTIHGMCNDYRAGATLDLDEARDDLSNNRLIRCPLRVIWGNRGVIEKCFDALKEWRAVTDKDFEVDGYSLDSGHFIPEEAPDKVVAAVLEFLV